MGKAPLYIVQQIAYFLYDKTSDHGRDIFGLKDKTLLQYVMQVYGPQFAEFLLDFL